MATITTTLKLVDRMTSTLNAIEMKTGSLSSQFTALDTSIENSQSFINNFSYSGFLDTCDNIAAKANALGDTLTAVFSIPGTLLGKKAYSTASDYEMALAGVQKTTDATGQELEAMNAFLLDTVENMPIAGGYAQAAATTQMGAQFGIHDLEMLERFTQTYEKLVTATDIQGEAGATQMAQFLNIVEGGAQNADRFGSTIVDLGNHFATAESSILGMATRMAGTAELADFATPEILALSAAVSSVGIAEEAGGSAAAKLIKSMQGAAEVGMEAYGLFSTEYGGAVGFSHYIENSENLLRIAENLNVTTDYVQGMADSWLDLENFAEISGKTADQLAADWANNPAQSMLDFFAGLGALDESGAESAIAAMERMGITEIRLSNMVAAMAGKSEIFRSALDIALAAYAENIALDREYDIFANTQASRDQMMKNKAMNTMADFGENVQQAVQPMLDYANSLLDVFNAMDEADQDKIVKIMGALIISGPAAKAVGAAATAIKTIGDTVVKLGAAGTGGILGSAALAFAISKLADVNGKVDEIIEHAAGIRFSFDEASVNEALGQIEQVRSALDLINGNAATEEARSTSEAVKLGWGTQGMYNTALAYESAVANSGIEQINTSYAAQIRALEEQIIRSQDETMNAAWFAEIEALELARDADITASRQEYTAAISDIFSGMIAQYPEEMERLERAAQQYDLLGTLWQMQNFDDSAYGSFEQAEAEWAKLQKTMFGAGWDLGYLADSGYESKEQIMNAIAGGMQMETQSWIEELEESATRDLTALGDSLAQNDFLGTLLQTMLSDQAVIENLDFTALDGAFSNLYKVMDFLNAARQAEEFGDVSVYGKFMVQGLASGVEDNAYLMDDSFYTLRDNTITALQNAFDMHSPSRLMALYGVYIPAGIADGVRMGQTMLDAAINAVCNGAVASASMILNSDSGYMIGAAFGQGMARGIRSQCSPVAAAARAVANAAAAAARSALDINSPSGVTEEIGRFFGEGFEIGILRSVKSAEGAAGELAGAAWDEMKLSDEDAKRIRSLAEREVVNHFTTAELHIDFTANNNINSEMDLDGVVRYLEDQLTERMQMAAEGVYE